MAYEIELRKAGGIEIVDDEKSVAVLPDFNLAKRHLVVGSFCKDVTIMHRCCIILVVAGSFNTPRIAFRLKYRQNDYLLISPVDYCLKI